MNILSLRNDEGEGARHQIATYLADPDAIPFGEAPFVFGHECTPKVALATLLLSQICSPRQEVIRPFQSIAPSLLIGLPKTLCETVIGFVPEAEDELYLGVIATDPSHGVPLGWVFREGKCLSVFSGLQLQQALEDVVRGKLPACES